MTLTTDDRPTAADWYTSARKNVSRPITFTSGLTVGAVGEWSAAVVRHDFDETTLFTPTLAVNGSTVTITLTAANLAGLLSTGSAKWAGRWRILHATTGVEFSGRLIVDRWGTQTGVESGAITAVVSGTTVTATVLGPYNPDLFVALSAVATGPEGRALVADAAATNGIRVRYPSPKGPRAGVTGTSIEIGSGGDSTYNGPYVPGRPSNADWLLHACANSGSKLRYQLNFAVGGQTLGGTAVVLADAAVGSTTIDVGGLLTGPALPFATQSIFVDYGNAHQEGIYANSVATITGGVRITGLVPTTVAHVAGETVQWGLIGLFDLSWPTEGLDILFIGGPTNDLSHLTAAQIAAGQQTLAEMALARDAVPVVTTITARSNLHDETDQANAAIRANALTYGHWCLDFYRVLADPVTRSMKSNLTADGTHPNQEGAALLGQEVHDGFLDHVEIRRDSRRRPSVDGYGYNAAPYGTFSSGDNGLTGGNFAPLGWTAKEFFSNGLITVSIVPPRLTDPVEGNLVQITSAAGQGTHGVQAVIPIAASGLNPGFAAGDQVFLEAFIRLAGFKSDGYAQATVTLVATGSTGAGYVTAMWGWVRDFEGVFTSQASVIPTNIGTLTSLSVQAYIVGPALGGGNSGYGTLEVGEVTVCNITRGDF